MNLQNLKICKNCKIKLQKFLQIDKRDMLKRCVNFLSNCLFGKEKIEKYS